MDFHLPVEALISQGLRDALDASFAEKEQAVASLVPLATAISMATLPRHSGFTEGSRRISSNHHMHWGRATRSLLSCFQTSLNECAILPPARGRKVGRLL